MEQLPGRKKDSVFACANSSLLYVKELEANLEKTVNLSPFHFEDDFPISIEISSKYHLIYIISRLGCLQIYDLETCFCLGTRRISDHPIFWTVEASIVGGFYAINTTGQVFLVEVNQRTIVPFVLNQLYNKELAISLASRGKLSGVESLAEANFNKLLEEKKYKEAILLATKTLSLRTPETVTKFQSVQVQDGQTALLLRYFAALLSNGKLTEYESLTLFSILMRANQKDLLKQWLAQDRLYCSKQMGELAETFDKDLAVKIYEKAKISDKVIEAYVERREFEKIPLHQYITGYTPDYLSYLRNIMQSDVKEASNFAVMLSQMNKGCPVDFEGAADLFVQRNKIPETIDFLLLDVSNHKKPAEVTKGADFIRNKKMFSGYNNIDEHWKKLALYARDVKNKPEDAPTVLGKLLDDNFHEDFIKGFLLFTLSCNLKLHDDVIVLILRGFVDRNRFELLSEFVEYLFGSTIGDVHTARAAFKILGDLNPEEFLKTNHHYCRRAIGKYCEELGRVDLAIVAYQEGACDDELINLTNLKSLFDVQSRYLFERKSVELWSKVLRSDNAYRTQLIDQVVSTVEEREVDEIEAAISGFEGTRSASVIYRFLDKLIFGKLKLDEDVFLNTIFMTTAVEVVNEEKILELVSKLNVDGAAVAEAAIKANMYDAAFKIFNKFGLNVQAVNVLLNNFIDTDTAADFLQQCFKLGDGL